MKIKFWIKLLLFIIITITLFFLYTRYVGIKGLKTNEFNIINENIPDSFYGYKIVHISDIHYKVTTDLNDLNNLVKEVNRIKPDIIVFTGDLFDHNIIYTEKDYEDLTNIFKSMNYSIGKFAIKGEEDLSNKNWDDIISNSDFTDLNNTYKLLYNNSLDPILLVGISSNYKNNHIKETTNNLKIDTDYKYSILLMHEADYINEIDYSKYNLVLAGHNHNGQIRLPFIVEMSNLSKRNC